MQVAESYLLFLSIIYSESNTITKPNKFAVFFVSMIKKNYMTKIKNV